MTALSAGKRRGAAAAGVEARENTSAHAKNAFIQALIEKPCRPGQDLTMPRRIAFHPSQLTSVEGRTPRVVTASSMVSARTLSAAGPPELDRTDYSSARFRLLYSGWRSRRTNCFEAPPNRPDANDRRSGQLLVLGPKPLNKDHPMSLVPHHLGSAGEDVRPVRRHN
jgi:hypothetical protein